MKDKRIIMDKKFYAHICENISGKFEYQTLKEHMENTARISSSILKSIGLYDIGYLAGILHDMGKYKNEFQTYLIDAASGKNVSKGSVVHTFSGVKYILEKYHDKCETRKSILAEVIAAAISSHHGLVDIEINDKDNEFLHRIKNDSMYQECLENFTSDCISEKELNMIFDKAYCEFEEVVKKIMLLIKQGDAADNTVHFYISLLDRLVLSALVEGDRLDTARFMHSYNDRRIRADWKQLSSKIDKKVDELPNSMSINSTRRQISDICFKAACGQKGVYRLNVPTGGGKTLASLRFAVHHAKVHDMSRVIFCTPLLSILEQNASVIRSYIDDDLIILESHSNVVQDVYDNSNILRKNELVLENWESPIVITTLVQLLNTLFHGDMTSVRRFHSLIDSIIVIDEVQTVPVRMLSLFNLAVNFLKEVCGATIVLSSATQPSIVEAYNSINVKIEEMVPYDKKMWDVFKRTKICYEGKKSIGELKDYVLEKLQNKKNMLVICNKKDEAEALYKDIKGDGIRCIHLSASMCMAHRKKTYNTMIESMKLSTIEFPFVCVSTQVIEAGVDISFQCVIRAMAGMDSIIQSAGRCNRNGEMEGVGEVYILDILNERLEKLPDIRRGKQATESLIINYMENSEKYENDLSSNLGISYYYEKYYNNTNKGAMDYYVPKCNTTILKMLGSNEDLTSNQSNEFYHHQAFKEAGRQFEVFDSNTIDVIVPYQDGLQIIEDLNSCPLWDLNKKQILINKAKEYTVKVYSWQRNRMESEGTLYWCMENTVAYITKENYNDDTGLCVERQMLSYLEV